MRGRVQLEPGWLLSTRNYRETSLLLEAFTPGYGRVGLIARGARGPRSKLRGLLQSLQPLLLSWQQAGELGTLTGVEAAGAPLGLGGERLFYGWYLNELVLRLLQREDPHPLAYAAYVRALARLTGEEAEFALRVFEKQLLSDIGYGLLLAADIDPEQRYDVDGEGCLQAAAGRGYAGVSLIALRDEQLPQPLPPRLLPELRRLLRAAIGRQLGGRELETRKLLRAMRQQQGLGAGD